MHSANSSQSHIPQQILDHKAEELRKRKEVSDQINVSRPLQTLMPYKCLRPMVGIEWHQSKMYHNLCLKMTLPQPLHDTVIRQAAP